MIKFGRDYASMNGYRLFASFGSVDETKLVEGELIPYPLAIEIVISWPLFKLRAHAEASPHWISSWRERTRHIQLGIMPLGWTQVCWRGDWKVPRSIGWHGRWIDLPPVKYAAPRVMPRVVLREQKRLRAKAWERCGVKAA